MILVKVIRTLLIRIASMSDLPDALTSSAFLTGWGIIQVYLGSCVCSTSVYLVGVLQVIEVGVLVYWSSWVVGTTRSDMVWCTFVLSRLWWSSWFVIVHLLCLLYQFSYIPRFNSITIHLFSEHQSIPADKMHSGSSSDYVLFCIIHSFKIYIAPLQLQGCYSEALPTLA